jgi:MarR family transcriptional regulator, organic hydroperoxide resistance regulator
MVQLFPIDDLLGFWIYRVQTQSAALLARRLRLAGYDITPEQFFVLARLREQQGLNQRQLGEITFKDRHNITRILNLLEKRGYIERRPDSGDKRIYRIYLTESGQEIQDKVMPVVTSHINHVLSDINDNNLTIMRRTLEKIAENIETKPIPEVSDR